MASTAAERTVEPWLRGPLEGIDVLVMPVFFTFAQVREDLATYTAGLTPEQVWRSLGSASLGFHLKHIADSVDRLSTYLVGAPLTPEQLAKLKEESLDDENLPALLEQIEVNLTRCEARLRTLPPDALAEPRGVGRQALPSTVIGLIVHLAEHTQRHLGQVVTLSQILRQLA